MIDPEYHEAILMSTRGVSAAVVFAAFQSLGNRKVEVYDRSFVSFYEHQFEHARRQQQATDELKEATSNSEGKPE